jgi:hypothetical protein
VGVRTGITDPFPRTFASAGQLSRRASAPRSSRPRTWWAASRPLIMGDTRRCPVTSSHPAVNGDSDCTGDRVRREGTGTLLRHIKGAAVAAGIVAGVMVGAASPALAFGRGLPFDEQVKACEQGGGKVATVRNEYRCLGGKFHGYRVAVDLPKGLSFDENYKMCQRGGGKVIHIQYGTYDAEIHICEGGKYAGSTVGISG